MQNIIKNRGSIYCTEDAWDSIKTLILDLAPSKVFILTDDNTTKFCLSYCKYQLELDDTPQNIVIPSGETHKTINTCSKVWNELSIHGADRDSLLINLGGGVVTDLGGFVASTYRRGIEFINVPTSLLAMVDASVGGKNGVDLGILKNQIGIIRNPKCVIIDTAFLQTLPENQITSGFAEMLKHGIIHSEAYWKKLKSFDISNNLLTKELIWESIEIKNKVVTEDPQEKGLRKTLNFGHTLGHAIESYCLEQSDKPSLLHGEAIAVGIILASYISKELFNFPEDKLDDITKTILSSFPKVNFTNQDIDSIIKLLIYDKKNSNGEVYFVLLSDTGEHKINCKVSNSLIHKAFGYYRIF